MTETDFSAPPTPGTPAGVEYEAFKLTPMSEAPKGVASDWALRETLKWKARGMAFDMDHLQPGMKMWIRSWNCSKMDRYQATIREQLLATNPKRQKKELTHEESGRLLIASALQSMMGAEGTWYAQESGVLVEMKKPRTEDELNAQRAFLQREYLRSDHEDPEMPPAWYNAIYACSQLMDSKKAQELHDLGEGYVFGASEALALDA